MELLRKSIDVCGVDEIYSAIDTYDMALVVRAATNALKYYDGLPIPYCFKTRADSLAARKAGNEQYKAGRYREAILLYNKAIAYAPFPSEEPSEELILALGNRSAVFFSIRYYSACCEDAYAACLAIQCPAHIRIKLEKRYHEALYCQRYTIDLITNTDFVCNFMSFNCKKNAEVPCASNDIAFVNRNGTKFVTARNKIKPGALVAIERAFSSCTVNNKYVCCYFCHRIDLKLYPCTFCSQVLFCGPLCRERCWNEYHKIECQVLDYQGEDSKYILITKAAIKLSLELGWDALIEASKDIGVSRMKKATVKQMYNPDEPLSILSYDDRTHLMGGKMFNGSLNCAAILHCLDKVPDYFPTEAKVRAAARDAMARIMLHLYVTFKNTIHIKCSAYDFNSQSFRSGVQTSYGWFSMSSKLKHSCEPNLMVVGLNDSVGLVALRTIAKGEELTISYIGHFYDHPIPSYQIEDKFKRTIHVFRAMRQTCDCRACENNWDSNSAINVQMSDKQDALFKKINRRITMDYKCFYSICSALDTFPINSIQHKRAYGAAKGMLKTIQSKYVQNSTWIE